MDTSVNVDMPSRPAHDPATAPGRFVVRDAHREDLPEAAAVQAVCFREIGQGVIPNDILTEVTGPGIVHTTIEQWKQFMDDGAVFKILVDRLDMMTVGVAMARISTSPDAPTPWEVATADALESGGAGTMLPRRGRLRPSTSFPKLVTAGPRTISSTPASDTARLMCGSLLTTPARSSSMSATGSTSTTLMVPLTTPSAGWNSSGSFARTRSKPNDDHTWMNSIARMALHIVAMVMGTAVRFTSSAGLTLIAPATMRTAAHTGEA